MANRLRVGVLFGGRSGEHAVSLMSARSVLQALDPNKYQVIPIGITPEGRWIAGGDPLAALLGEQSSGSTAAALLPDPTAPALVSRDEQVQTLGEIDVVFPVLHGTYGEDGCIQGLCELAGVPYVGCGVAASAVGMDKALMKAVFAQAGLPQTAYLVVQRRELDRDMDGVVQRIEQQLGYPCFVKPANLGSSVGITKAKNTDQLRAGLQEAAAYDRKLVVEQAATDCREVEVSILGNDAPIASTLGEIVPSNEFYDYQAKYLDGRSELIIPARVSDAMAEQVKQLAIRAFQAIDGEGLARVDFFVKEDESALYVNEINTMPGFTQISMYPKLWEASGIPYPQLVDRLIELAFERHAERGTQARVRSRMSSEAASRGDCLMRPWGRTLWGVAAAGIVIWAALFYRAYINLSIPAFGPAEQAQIALLGLVARYSAALLAASGVWTACLHFLTRKERSARRSARIRHGA